MTSLRRSDFCKVAIIRNNFYYLYTFTDGHEIKMQPCLNGFDVSLISPEGKLVEKKCTDLGYTFDIYERMPVIRYEAFDLAIKIANKYYRAVDERNIRSYGKQERANL